MEKYVLIKFHRVIGYIAPRNMVLDCIAKELEVLTDDGGEISLSITYLEFPKKTYESLVPWRGHGKDHEGPHDEEIISDLKYFPFEVVPKCSAAGDSNTYCTPETCNGGCL